MNMLLSVGTLNEYNEIFTHVIYYINDFVCLPLIVCTMRSIKIENIQEIG